MGRLLQARRGLLLPHLQLGVRGGARAPRCGGRLQQRHPGGWGRRRLAAARVRGQVLGVHLRRRGQAADPAARRGARRVSAAVPVPSVPECARAGRSAADLRGSVRRDYRGSRPEDLRWDGHSTRRCRGECDGGAARDGLVGRHLSALLERQRGPARVGEQFPPPRRQVHVLGRRGPGASVCALAALGPDPRANGGLRVGRPRAHGGYYADFHGCGGLALRPGLDPRAGFSAHSV